MVHGVWCMVHGVWRMVYCISVWRCILARRCTISVQCMVHGAWCTVHGVSRMGYGAGCTV
jgi:hypothetical protein